MLWMHMLLVAACGGASIEGSQDDTLGIASYPWPVPTSLPLPSEPADNPTTEAKVALGRHLFFDRRLSGNGSQSCADCHDPKLAFSDGRAVSVGSTGDVGVRNSSALVNLAYAPSLTWANPLLRTLESQIEIPLFGEHPIEMGATGHEEEILARLAAEPRYGPLFNAAFEVDADAGAESMQSADAITFERVIQALASFVRALVSLDAPRDRYLYGGQLDAMSPAALRGQTLFFSERLECHHCHGGFNFNGSVAHDGTESATASFFNTGLYNIDGKGGYPREDLGLFELTGNPRHVGRFRAPTLRNIALTAPYMHDGSVETLSEVLDIYAAGGRHIIAGPHAGDGRQSPLKSGFVGGFVLTDGERSDVIAFLESLTDQAFVENKALGDPW